VHLVVAVEPPILGELISRALEEPLAEVELREEPVDASTSSLTVTVVTGDEPVEGDVVVRLHEGSDQDVVGAVYGSPNGAREISDLAELVERVREAAAAR